VGSRCNPSMEEVQLGRFRICTFDFSVSLKSPNVSYASQWFRKVFAHFKTTTQSVARQRGAEQISEWRFQHGNMEVFADRHFVIELNTAQPSELITSLSQAEISIINYAVSRIEESLWLHGACLAKNGELIFFIAPSGGGKTTLSLAFVANGLRLLTDDVIVITKDLAIQPFPRCPKIRTSALEQLSSIGYDLPQSAELLGRYVILPDKTWVKSAINILNIPKTFFILTHGESLKEPRELNTSELMIEWSRCSNFLYQDGSLPSKLLRNSRAYKLPTLDLNTNIEQIRSLTNN